MVKKNILEKRYTKENPIIVASFEGLDSKKNFSKAKNYRIIDKKKIALAFYFKYQTY